MCCGKGVIMHISSTQLNLSRKEKKEKQDWGENVFLNRIKQDDVKRDTSPLRMNDQLWSAKGRTIDWIRTLKLNQENFADQQNKAEATLGNILCTYLAFRNCQDEETTIAF